MHILFVADGDSKYGASTSMYQMVSELKNIDKEMKVSVVLTPESTMASKFQKIGCTVYQVPYSPYMQDIPYQKWKFPIKYMLYGLKYLYGILCAGEILSKKLDMSQIDLIHSNSSREDLSAELANKYSIPLIWHIREFGDSAYQCFSYRNDYINMMNHSATELIAISDAVRFRWIERGICTNKIKTIYNGVLEYDYGAIRVDKHNGLHCITAGYVIPSKGQEQLVKAVCSLSQERRNNIYVDIVGDGNKKYVKYLNGIIKRNHMEDRIRFLGYQKDLYKWIAQYDCGVMCSRSEGFGRVTAEYMMAGLPVIASDTGANPEIITDGEEGLLYQYGNIDDLKSKIVYLMDHQEIRRSMGEKASETAHARFTARINAENVYKEYCDILGITK